MAAYTPHTLSMFTACFSSAAIATTARRTGFVQRASKITGQLFLALVTCGVWSEAQTTLAQLAAKGTQVAAPLAVSPEAMHPRMHKRALVCLQALLRPALATIHPLATACAEGRCACLSTVSMADSTGCGLPASLQARFPGSGGSAAKAGATMQAVWASPTRVLGHCALTPWNLPEQKDIDPVSGVAPQGAWFLLA
jgi:hypothetical protein